MMGRYVTAICLFSVATMVWNPGKSLAEKETERDWPKELDAAMQLYKSKSMRAQITDSLFEVVGVKVPAGQRHLYPPPDLAKRMEAVEFLLDLRNDEITFWLLTKGPATMQAVQDLAKRKVSPRDAPVIAKALIFKAFSRSVAGGEENEVIYNFLNGLASVYCRSIEQKWEPLPGRLLPEEIRTWALEGAEKAPKDNQKNPARRFELERLKAEITSFMK